MCVKSPSPSELVNNSLSSDVGEGGGGGDDVTEVAEYVMLFYYYLLTRCTRVYHGREEWMPIIGIRYA